MRRKWPACWKMVGSNMLAYFHSIMQYHSNTYFTSVSLPVGGSSSAPLSLSLNRMRKQPIQRWEQACYFIIWKHNSPKHRVLQIIGIFAPFLPTERMMAAIGRTMLEEIVVPMILPDLVLDDTAILTAVRVCLIWWIHTAHSYAVRDFTSYLWQNY